MMGVKAPAPTLLGDLAAVRFGGDVTTIARQAGVQESSLGGALVQLGVQSDCTPTLACVE
jgi:hypothetical protein